MNTLEQHNRSQQAYFADATKRTMIPRTSQYLLRHIEKFIAATGLSRDQNILEIGCGMGRYTLPLLAQGYQVTGLDLTPQLLDALRQRLPEGVEAPLLCVDIHNPPVKLLGQFDAVIGFFMLHHIFDLEHAFAAIARLARPGGFTAFIEPNAYNPLYYMQILLSPGMTWEGDKGVAQMRRGKVLRAMQQAGFVDTRLERFGFFPPFITNTIPGLQLEGWFEKMPLWYPLLPFQIFFGRLPE